MPPGWESIRMCFPARFPGLPLLLSAFGIEFAHPLDMAREMPFRYEGRDDGLRKLGTAACKFD